MIAPANFLARVASDRLAAAPANEHDEPGDSRTRDIRASAKAIEQTFIAEMLKHSGLTEALTKDAGFAGEAYSSLIADGFAREMSAGRGIGLAETIFRQLMERDG